ncbi:MAG: universal stress protein [Candidatus Nitrosopolaris sp.]
MSLIKFSKILIPIDGSEFSIRAVDYGIAMAKKEENVQLVALHVLFFREESSISFMASLSGAHASFEIPEKINQEIERWFDKIKEKTNQNEVQLKTDVVISAKPIIKIIVDYAEAGGFDLIVVGTRGSSHFKKLLLGGVASGVVTYAHCPVMVIK